MNDRELPEQKTQGDAVASKNPPKRIPVNLIAGSLGVGKTTAMNHLLNQRPDHERWAVLVNEYGLVGLDAALMATPGKEAKTGGVEIREVAGGCICCSAGIMFEMSLVLLLQRRLDRLLIEPTGLAALSGILDTLDRPGICEAIDVRSVLCLLDRPIRRRLAAPRSPRSNRGGRHPAGEPFRSSHLRATATVRCMEPVSVSSQNTRSKDRTRACPFGLARPGQRARNSRFSR